VLILHDDRCWFGGGESVSVAHPSGSGYSLVCGVCGFVLPFDGRDWAVFNPGLESTHLYEYEVLHHHLTQVRLGCTPFDQGRRTIEVQWMDEYARAWVYLSWLVTELPVRSDESMRLAALWRSEMFQRDFFRYVASMRIQYDQAFSCAACVAQGGVSHVTLDGTTVGMPRGLVVNVPLEPDPDAEAKPTKDQCVLRVPWGVTHKDACSVSKRVFLYGEDVDAARLYMKSLATGAAVNRLEFGALLGFLNNPDIPRYTATRTFLQCVVTVNEDGAVLPVLCTSFQPCFLTPASDPGRPRFCSSAGSAIASPECHVAPLRPPVLDIRAVRPG
jgi:hypothetical protein